jgi:uncharacterized membrane protein
MMESLLSATTLVAAIGSGVVGGVFFGFSGFVMRALDRLRPAQGIAAMQSINVVAVTPPLMTALFGTALTCLGLVASSLLRWREPVAPLRLAGGLVYLAGTVGVTMLGNVPRNNALAPVDPESTGGEKAWREYVPGWTAWNTVRTVAAVAAAALFALALWRGEAVRLPTNRQARPHGVRPRRVHPRTCPRPRLPWRGPASPESAAGRPF